MLGAIIGDISGSKYEFNSCRNPNFEIIDKLGEGAYSTVYKVKRKIDNNIYSFEVQRKKSKIFKHHSLDKILHTSVYYIDSGGDIYEINRYCKKDR